MNATVQKEPVIPFSIEEQNRHLRMRVAELERALRGLQGAVHEYRLLDVRNRFLLCVADAAASKALRS